MGYRGISFAVGGGRSKPSAVRKSLQGRIYVSPECEIEVKSLRGLQPSLSHAIPAW